MRKPVIIDCDPGIDDAVAILMAYASDNLEIKAITTVAGNQTLEKTTLNALRMVEFAGRDTKVAKGASKPLIRDLVTAEWVHGSSGLGNVVLPEPVKKPYDKNAWDTIYEEALGYSGKLCIIALGPLTNIALALIKYPDIKGKIESITLMGGSGELGNDTPAAEFNFLVDPEAAKIVFEAGIPTTMVGLDATHKAYITYDDLDDIEALNNRASDFFSRTTRPFLELCKKFELKGAAMHDPSAVAYAIDNTLFTTRMLKVDVETRGEFTSGKTIVDFHGVTRKNPNINVALDVDRERLVKTIKGLLMKYDF